uniref:Uncharacterized protein n=1 Tax=Leersia perrieri TaxID=77586 RepID=A0A0D9XEX0_9ORYZ
MNPAAAEMGGRWPVEFLGGGGGIGGEAVYCAVILWLSVVAWIIFTSVGDDGERGRRRRHRRSSPVFVGAAGICDGTGPGCSGGFGPCGTCVD